MPGLSDALQKLKSAVGDLSSLEVNTYVGKLDASIEATDGVGLIDFSKVVEKAKSAEGVVSLAASTRINFDGDSNQFFTTDDVPQHVIEAHRLALEAGHDVRQGLISLFSSALGVSLPKQS